MPELERFFLKAFSGACQETLNIKSTNTEVIAINHFFFCYRLIKLLVNYAPGRRVSIFINVFYD